VSGQEIGGSGMKVGQCEWAGNRGQWDEVGQCEWAGHRGQWDESRTV
jgi:hypothetical protein